MLQQPVVSKYKSHQLLRFFPQIIVAIASPTGLDVNSNIPIADTPTILRATHIPVPRKISKIEIKKIVRNNSGITNHCFVLKLTK